MKTKTEQLVIELRDAGVSFVGKNAVKNLSVGIRQGSVNALIGSSGSGKSTTLKLINRLVTNDHGTIEVFGKNIGSVGARGLRQIRSKIGYIPQDLGLVEPATAEENVLMGALPTLVLPRMGSWMYSKGLRSRAIDIMSELGIEQLAAVRVKNLSGGQRQRVAIGRTLMQGAEILLADEPVSSLDQVIAEDVLELFQKIAKSNGMTVLVSLHQVELAKKFADRIVALRDGSVFFDGAPSLLTQAIVQQTYER